jgi:hypothetical protein
LVQDILTKDNLTTLEYLPFSPNLAAVDFYVFPPMNSEMKGSSFCDPSEFVRNAAEELKGFHKMASRNVSDTLTVLGRSVCLH